MKSFVDGFQLPGETARSWRPYLADGWEDNDFRLMDDQRELVNPRGGYSRGFEWFALESREFWLLTRAYIEPDDWRVWWGEGMAG